MPDESVLQILISRDKMSPEDAKELLEELKEEVRNGEDPEEVLYGIGLEPDYIFDLLD